MDQMYIVAFIKSVQHVFQTMLQLAVKVGTPHLKTPGEHPADVTGIIGMSGDVDGAVVLSFPTATAERVVSLFTGTELTSAHEDFADAVGELVNIISGAAKAQFPGKKVSITCPSVVIGNRHSVWGAKDVVCVNIPCDSDCGVFAVEVSIRAAAGQQAAGSPASSPQAASRPQRLVA